MVLASIATGDVHHGHHPPNLLPTRRLALACWKRLPKSVLQCLKDWGGSCDCLPGCNRRGPTPQVPTFPRGTTYFMIEQAIEVLTEEVRKLRYCIEQQNE